VHPDQYVLLRIFAYSDSTDSGAFYELHGPLTDHVDLEPTEFRASLRTTQP
jgi:hypothetical protein